MIAYLDTSVVLRAVLRDGPVLPHWGAWRRAYSSDLLEVESRRTIDRLRLTGVLDDDGVLAALEALRALRRSIGAIALNRRVLLRAAMPMRTVVNTLDAIHLASAMMLQDRMKTEVTVMTHDAQQYRGALGLGLKAAGAIAAP